MVLPVIFPSGPVHDCLFLSASSRGGMESVYLVQCSINKAFLLPRQSN